MNTNINLRLLPKFRLLYQHVQWQPSWLAVAKRPTPLLLQPPYPSRPCSWETDRSTVTKLRCTFGLRWYKPFQISQTFSYRVLQSSFITTWLICPISIFTERVFLCQLILTPAATVAAVQSDLPAVTSCSSLPTSSQVQTFPGTALKCTIKDTRLQYYTAVTSRKHEPHCKLKYICDLRSM